MTVVKPRRSVIALVAVLLAVFAAGLLTRGAAAATKPRIVGVSLVSGHEFTAGTVLVYGATGVAVCVSHVCKRALNSQSGVWNLTPGGLPKLVRGQSRQAIVFAVNGTGGFSYLIKQVIVK